MAYLIYTKLFFISGAARVRELPADQFCQYGFVIGKASEAGFGNEMYKILTAAAMSVMLNRSLIIGQTRHIGSLSSLTVSVGCDFSFLIVPLPCSANSKYHVDEKERRISCTS